MNDVPPPPLPRFSEALRFWIKLGFISFGGPAGQIAIMHTELVERKRWLSESHFLHALNFCMLLPGPEAQQLATYLGWRLHGVRGGIAAGVLFVLPSMFILFGLSWLFIVSGNVPWLAAVFYGLLPAVIAIVAAALLRIGGKALRSPTLWALAGFSFIAIFHFKISFVLIIATAALAGWTGNRIFPRQFPAGKGHDGQQAHDEVPSAVLPPAPKPTLRRALGIIAICLALWWVPIIGLGLWLGWSGTHFQMGLFFSKAALVTFGGAYAVLPYVAQQAVENYAWLSHPEMMSGLGLAETTPGPLIMVLQFVGFVGGWHFPSGFTPLAGATLGALVTTWVTFVPCFLFVFLGAPHVEKLRDQPRLGAAMTAITAAVVGVILNLAVWFAWHALWPHGWNPEAGLVRGLDPFVAVVSILAFVALRRTKISLLAVIGLCVAAGLASKALGF
jgi:chromate transporter